MKKIITEILRTAGIVALTLIFVDNWYGQDKDISAVTLSNPLLSHPIFAPPAAESGIKSLVLPHPSHAVPLDIGNKPLPVVSREKFKGENLLIRQPLRPAVPIRHRSKSYLRIDESVIGPHIRISAFHPTVLRCNSQHIDR